MFALFFQFSLCADEEVLMRLENSAICALAVAIISLSAPAHAVDGLNIYSARHYDSDSLLYDGFEDATGIPVNVIEGEGPELLARMKAEGKNSPAMSS